MKIYHTCCNEDCEHEFQICATGGCEARLSGPPEDCYPAESPDIEPTECPKCGTEVDIDKVLDKVAEAKRDAYEAHLEDKADERREEGYYDRN